MYNMEKSWVCSEYMEKIRIEAYWVFVSSTGKESMHLDKTTATATTTFTALKWLLSPQSCYE